jgi:hypothetical protein
MRGASEIREIYRFLIFFIEISRPKIGRILKSEALYIRISVLVVNLLSLTSISVALCFSST